MTVKCEGAMIAVEAFEVIGSMVGFFFQVTHVFGQGHLVLDGTHRRVASSLFHCLLDTQ